MEEQIYTTLLYAPSPGTILREIIVMHNDAIEITTQLIKPTTDFFSEAAQNCNVNVRKHFSNYRYGGLSHVCSDK